MKYLQYTYTLDVPREEAFSQVMDLEMLQTQINLFSVGNCTSDQRHPEEIGKTYVLSLDAYRKGAKTIIALEKINRPETAEFSYTYRIIDSTGNLQSGSFLPWESMVCSMSFKEQNGKTIVDTIMYANGVHSLWQRIHTRLLSYINYFQQRKVIARVKNFVENHP